MFGPSWLTNAPACCVSYVLQPLSVLFLLRFGAKPSSVTKNSGEAHAVVVFSAPEHRTLFWGEFQKADQAGGSVGSAGQFLVKFPGKYKSSDSWCGFWVNRITGA